MNEKSLSVGSRPNLIRLYGRLKGLESALSGRNPEGIIGRDFNSVVDLISKEIPDDLSEFLLSQQDFYGQSPHDQFVRIDVLRSRVAQLRGFLEYGFQVGDAVVNVGNLFRSIQDKTLNERCADLLSAPSNFDRVINQATQVLEDRIRRKVNDQKGLTGVPLVNEYIKAKPTESTLVLSDAEDEQSGFSNILRGLMLAFRNPTHHHIADKFSREEALKVCAFIDNLLPIIERATVRKDASN